MKFTHKHDFLPGKTVAIGKILKLVDYKGE